ncbi:porin [Colwellia sp. 1_MG-2023]|uniref:porin n=1 Tax=unclassified Colwellia TaxID=196834 RepID=UPI001C087619|nr:MULTISPECIES: porin [unclassified Colwellia]MBU2924831.1 porin [Colwellia sp. C2M11]MDO6654066.1 porin [Colwellia sp. 3_MG-2023]MDO6665484.1 porin [Colwellia sp. 2_MG-2023]MDO6689757.1 porin [Colwellia sp. 1_MG-2023]
MNRKLKYTLIASCLLVQPTFTAYANKDSRIDNIIEKLDKVKISGYLNLTAGKAKKSIYFASNTDGYEDFSVTAETWGGVQIDFKATEKLDFTLLTKFYAESRDYDEAFGVDLAYLTYQLTDQTKIRAGILRVPLYKDSDYKDTGFAQLWLRAPELVYANNKVQRYTGLEILQDFYVGDGTIQVQAFYGQNEDLRAKAASNSNKNFIIDDLMGIHATYSINEHLYKMGVTTRTEPGDLEDFLSIKTNGKPTLHAYGYQAGYRQTFYSLGYGYDDGEWKVDIETIFETATGGKSDNGKYYASVGYRFDAITPYVMYQYRETLDDSKRFKGANVYVHTDGTEQSFFNAKTAEQSIISVGARYDISSNLAIKVQAERYDVENYTIYEKIQKNDNTLYSVSLQAVF